LAAALLSESQHLGSINRNAPSGDIAGYLIDKMPGGVIEIQLEGAFVRIAALA
jgi:hypothetical protein